MDSKTLDLKNARLLFLNPIPELLDDNGVRATAALRILIKANPLTSEILEALLAAANIGFGATNDFHGRVLQVLNSDFADATVRQQFTSEEWARIVNRFAFIFIWGAMGLNNISLLEHLLRIAGVPGQKEIAVAMLERIAKHANTPEVAQEAARLLQSRKQAAS